LKNGSNDDQGRDQNYVSRGIQKLGKFIDLSGAPCRARAGARGGAPAK
jgi:hypothetical protein